ncbi:hypothetical protein [Methylobacterium sp. CM6257]
MDRPIETTALQEFNRDLMSKLRGYQISLQAANQMAKAAVDERDRAVSEAAARVEAMQAVLGALIGSLRPYGLDRRKFVASIQSIAEEVPTDGPKAVQHTVLHSESTRVLRRRQRA